MAAAPPTDLAAPATPSTALAPDLEDAFKVELVDWDEDGIEDAGVVTAGCGYADPPELELKTSEAAPHAGESATGGHPKLGGVTPASTTGPVGEARAGSDSEAHSGYVCTVIDTSSLPPPPARSSAPSSLPQAAKGRGYAKDAGKAPPPKLKSILVRPDWQPDPALRAGKQVWQRLELKKISAEGYTSLATQSSKPPAAQVWDGHQAEPAKLWEVGESSRVNDRLGELQNRQLSPTWQAAKTRRRERQGTILL
jgi:hypothetical protein